MKNRILQLEEFIISIPNKIRELCIDLIKQCYTVIGKLKDLSQTNYNLGIFHIDKGNINDAKMRFRFTIKLNPEIALSHYHLARCHIFDLEFDKAKQ